ncbi:MAG: hypothetical protein QX203_17570, partial [Methylococcaceae bacterium]
PRPALARVGVSGIPKPRDAGNAGPALKRGQAYSGLHQDVYNDERSGVRMPKYRSDGTGRRREGRIAEPLPE